MHGWCDYQESFGDRRLGGRRHQGIDMFAATNAPIYAVSDGRITSALTDHPGSLGGNQLKLKRKDGTYFIYAHLSSFADGIELGVPVHAGDVLGYLGASGAAASPHLHFEVHPWGNSAVDPTMIVANADTCGDRAVSAAVSSYNARHDTPAPQDSTPADTEPAKAAIAPSAPSSALPVTFDQPPTVYTSNGEYINGGKPHGIQVVGYPGIPSDSTKVDLTFTVTGKGEGWAAVWPCGEKAGIDSGTPLAGVSKTETQTRLVMRPGTGGRICFQSTGQVNLDVEVNAVQPA